MADLTRFDFHVLRFMKSLDVMAMTDAEIGQYILLLSESWLIGDACTLPNDLELLARLARTAKVSDKVMKKFPLCDTEYGSRRRNPVLFAEWMAAEERSLSAAERGRKGNEVRYGGTYSSQQSRYSEATAIPNTSPKPSQAVSNQTNSTQSNSAGEFKNIAVRYRRAFHVNLARGTMQKTDYAKTCERFGEDLVLAKFDEWAPENMWIKDRKHNSGLRQFYEGLPDMIEADSAITIEKQTEDAILAEQLAASKAGIAASSQKMQEEHEAWKKQNDEDLAWAEAHKDSPF